MTKIILNGVYSTGKTTFGDWLRDERGFEHINLEAMPRESWEGIPAKVATSSKPTVVTWGMPIDEASYSIVRSFARAGFAAWWFDAELGLARIKYIKRSGEAEAIRYFDEQMGRLRNAAPILEELYGRRRITVLTQVGFVDPAEILSILTSG